MQLSREGVAEFLAKSVYPLHYSIFASFLLSLSQKAQCCTRRTGDRLATPALCNVTKRYWPYLSFQPAGWNIAHVPHISKLNDGRVSFFKFIRCIGLSMNFAHAHFTLSGRRSCREKSARFSQTRNWRATMVIRYSGLEFLDVAKARRCFATRRTREKKYFLRRIPVVNSTSFTRTNMVKHQKSGKSYKLFYSYLSSRSISW